MAWAHTMIDGTVTILTKNKRMGDNITFARSIQRIKSFFTLGITD
jgi:hypothetical protein